MFVVSLRVQTLRVREVMERSSRDDGRMVANVGLEASREGQGESSSSMMAAIL